MSLQVRSLALTGTTAVVVLGTVAPVSAMTEDECFDRMTDTSESCVGTDGDWTISAESGTGIPAGFGFLIFVMVIVGIGITIWKVSTARNLARQAGMDPNTATGMTLLDDNGLSATYLASSLRTSQQVPAPVAPVASNPTAANRLDELKGLLDRGLVTQAEYDERRKAIIDSV